MIMQFLLQSVYLAIRPRRSLAWISGATNVRGLCVLKTLAPVSDRHATTEGFHMALLKFQPPSMEGKLVGFLAVLAQGDDSRVRPCASGTSPFVLQ